MAKTSFNYSPEKVAELKKEGKTFKIVDNLTNTEVERVLCTDLFDTDKSGCDTVYTVKNKDEETGRVSENTRYGFSPYLVIEVYEDEVPADCPPMWTRILRCDKDGDTWTPDILIGFFPNVPHRYKGLYDSYKYVMLYEGNEDLAWKPSKLH